MKKRSPETTPATSQVRPNRHHCLKSGFRVGVFVLHSQDFNREIRKKHEGDCSVASSSSSKSLRLLRAAQLEIVWKIYTRCMETIICILVFSMMGFGTYALSKNETALSHLRKGHPNNDVVRACSQIRFDFLFRSRGAVFYIAAILSLVGWF